MASAKKLPSGSWRVMLYTGKDSTGKRVYKSFTASTKKEAEFLAAEYNLKKKERPKNITVGDAIDGYIASKEHVLSPTTIAEYRQTRRNKLQSIMDVPLAKINNIKIQQAINEDAARLSPKSVKNAHGLLSAALKMYMPDFVLRTTLPQKMPKIKTLPEPEQILEVTAGTDIELPVLLAIWLGLRLSEILGLRFSDIDKDGYITISHVRVAVRGKFCDKNTTKTKGSTRRIRAPKEILDKISKVPHKDKSDYIFNYYVGGIYSRFQKILRNANMPRISFHDLRHMNASIMLKLGIPDKYAMERGGWSSNEVLKNVYQHTFDSERVAVDDKIDSYFIDMQHKMQLKSQK